MDTTPLCLNKDIGRQTVDNTPQPSKNKEKKTIQAAIHTVVTGRSDQLGKKQMDNKNSESYL